MWECGAPNHPPRQTHQRCIREHPPSLHAVCHLIKSLSLFCRFLYSSQNHATLPPHPPAPTLGGIGGRRFSGRVPRVQPALSCRCPSRSKRPRRMGRRHKRPPTSGPSQRPLLPGGAVGPQGAREGNFCGWGSRSTRGWRGDPLVGVRGGGAAGTRAARAGDSSFGPELQGASEDSAEPPTAPFPSPTPPQPQSTAQLRQRSKQTQLQGPPPASRGLPHRAPRSLPAAPPPPSTGQEVPLNAPGGGSPFPLPAPGEADLGTLTSAGRPARRPQPRRGRAEEQIETHRPLLAAGSGAPYRGGDGGSIAGWSRSARHQLRQTRGAGAGRAQGARRRRLQPQLPAPPGGEAPHLPRRPPRSRPDSAAWRWAASGSFRVTAQTNAPSGWGREAGPGSPRYRPPRRLHLLQPLPPTCPGGPSVCVSVCLSGIANHLRGEELPTLPRALPRPCPLGPNLSGDLDVVLSTRECGT